MNPSCSPCSDISKNVNPPSNFSNDFYPSQALSPYGPFAIQSQVMNQMKHYGSGNTFYKNCNVDNRTFVNSVTHLTVNYNFFGGEVPKGFPFQAPQK